MTQIKWRIFVCVLLVGAGLLDDPRLAGAQVPKDAQRKAAAEKALQNLSGRLRKDGLHHPSGYDGSVVVYSTAGLAFLASGSTLTAGPYKDELSACAKFVMAKTGAKDKFLEGFKIPGRSKFNMDQAVWGYAHSTIFLANLHRSAKSNDRKQILPVLSRFADALVKAQTARGGWCHSLADVANPLGYTDFVATTNLALLGLGLAKAEGVKVPEDTLKKGIQYLVNSSDGKGHVGYSPRDGQRGNPEAGRTAGAILAFRATGQTKHPEYPWMLRHLSGHLGRDLNQGHGSAQLGLMQAAWACQDLGKDAWSAFWAQQGAAILSRQQADGAIIPPVGDAVFGKDSDSPVEKGDRATATHALILLLPEGHLGRKSSGAFASEERVALLEEAIKLLGEHAPDSAKEFLKATKQPSGEAISARRLDSLFRGDFNRVFIDIAKSGADRKLKARVLIAQLGLSTSVEAAHDARRRAAVVVISVSTAVSGVSGRVLFRLPEGSTRAAVTPSTVRPTAVKSVKFKKTIPLAAGFSGPLEIQVGFVWSRGTRTFTSLEKVTVEVP
jgi:hypothetical protein